MYGCCITAVYLQEHEWCVALIFLLLRKEMMSSKSFLQRSNSPIHKFFKLLTLRSNIFLRFLVTELLEVDYILSAGTLG